MTAIGSKYDILVMVPTYNEALNITSLLERLLALNLEADFLFVDDNSPDGTGKILDEFSLKHPNIYVLHRPTKNGIGTAHQAGISWAYLRKYKKLITMDGDFTHTPEDIPKLLAKSDQYDIVIGGRHARKDSLEGWTIWRKLLTTMGHQFTLHLLGFPYDATTAFRIYRLDKIPQPTFWLMYNPSYPFFIESLCILHENGFTMYDVPVILPPRAAGTSKLKFNDMVDWLFTSIKLGLMRRMYRSALLNSSTK